MEQPGCLYYLSCWYTRNELALRTACLYSGILASRAFSSLIAAAITVNMDGAGGLRGWRWLFLIEGIATIVISAIGFFSMPDFPRNTTWLSEDEAVLAAWRLHEEVGKEDWTSGKGQPFWEGFWLVLTDVKTWLLAPILFGIMSASSVTSFFPSAMGAFHHNQIATLLLLVPPYLFGIVVMLGNAWHADKTGERFYHITLPVCVAIVGFIIAAATTSTSARYASIMLMVPGLYSGYTIALVWISNTLTRPPAKRAAGLAFIDSIAHSSNTYFTYMYPKSAAPAFSGAFVHNCVLAAVAIAGAFALKVKLLRLNKQLEREELVEGTEKLSPEGTVNQGFRFLV
ncbi:hypothetical protein CDD83_1597 [Cordyceps sp. RAO-2017]|nr:hypothetical protein CDD83_1597 [Cordyceps sp. RAO-2017]